MKFLVVTSAPTLKSNGSYAAYAPYVNEMDIWFNHVNNATIVSPTVYNFELLVSSFKKQPEVISVPSLSFTSFFNIIKSAISIPIIVYRLIVAMSKADHIHLRSPGNIGLLGCLVQILYPKKTKTAKYAGNWDPKAKQPLSYRIQKWVLSNTFLTKNMQVLVYGNWQGQTKNIKPFFTASFNKSEIETPFERNYCDGLNFIFVGSLVNGKRPLFAINIVEALYMQGRNVRLNIFGDGVLKTELERYISKNKLQETVRLHGNQSKEQIIKGLKNAHFLILPSKSEGWPKAVAEAMFFGVIPIATSISCVPNMLDYGNRGILIESEVNKAVLTINDAIYNKDLKRISKLASGWSQNFTLDYFESEIKKLLIE